MKLNPSLIVAIALLPILGSVRFAAAGGQKPKTEVEGSWKLVKGGKDAPKKLTFTNNKFVVTLAEDRVFEGTFKLNTDENPSWMDMTFSASSDQKYKGKVALCIYNFDGEAFNWCASMPGRQRRPQQFVEIMGDARLLLGTYERDKKQP